MIEQLSSERPHETLRERIHVGCSWCGPHDARAGAFERLDEPLPELAVPVTDEYGWRSIHGRVARLLCAPVVGRRIGDSGVHDLSAP